MLAIAVVGLFDPVIQTPVAGFVVPVLVGALASVPASSPAVRPPRGPRLAVLVGIVRVGGLLITARVRDAWATYLYGTRPTLESLELAAWIDPGSYIIRAMTAAMLLQRGQCDAAAPHLEATRRMYPSAPGLDAMEARCSGEDRPVPEGG